MLPPIYTTLHNNNAVSTIVSNRIYRHGNAPQDTTKPYVTWNLINDDPENNLSDLPPVDRCTIQVDCWHQTDAGIETLAIAVRDAIEPHAHMTGIPIDNREIETKLFRISLQFDWFLDR